MAIQMPTIRPAMTPMLNTTCGMAAMLHQKGRRPKPTPRLITKALQLTNYWLNGSPPEPSLVPLWNRRSPVLRWSFSIRATLPGFINSNSREIPKAHADQANQSDDQDCYHAASLATGMAASWRLDLFPICSPVLQWLWGGLSVFRRALGRRRLARRGADRAYWRLPVLRGLHAVKRRRGRIITLREKRAATCIRAPTPLVVQNLREIFLVSL